jgi:hypothetical protein
MGTAVDASGEAAFLDAKASGYRERDAEPYCTPQTTNLF